MNNFNARRNFEKGLRGRPRLASEERRANGYKDSNGRYQISELKPWHSRVVDVMIVNPHVKVVDLAEMFNVSPQWMGQLLKADAFCEYYQQRLLAHREKTETEIVHRMQTVAVKALGHMDKVMSSDDPSFGNVKEAAELALKGLGYTQRGGSGVQINVKPGEGDTFVSVSSSALNRAREKARKLREANTEEAENDTEAFMQVTASLEKGYDEIEDAVVVSESSEEL